MNFDGSFPSPVWNTQCFSTDHLRAGCQGPGGCSNARSPAVPWPSPASRPQTPGSPPPGTHCPGMLRGQPLPAPPLPAPIGPQTVYPSPTGSWHHRSGKPRPYCCRDLEACPPHSVATVTLGLRMWPCKCCRLQPLVGCGEMFWCPWAAPAPLLLWWGCSHSFSSWRPARS